jgi:hypothetical protein
MGKTVSFRFKKGSAEDKAFARLFLESERKKAGASKEETTSGNPGFIMPGIFITAYNDPRLSLKAKAMFAGALIAQANGLEVGLSVDAFQSASTDRETAIRSGWQELLESGYIKRRSARANKQQPPRWVTEIGNGIPD